MSTTTHDDLAQRRRDLSYQREQLPDGPERDDVDTQLQAVEDAIARAAREQERRALAVEEQASRTTDAERRAQARAKAELRGDLAGTFAEQLVLGSQIDGTVAQLVEEIVEFLRLGREQGQRARALGLTERQALLLEGPRLVARAVLWKLSEAMPSEIGRIDKGLREDLSTALGRLGHLMVEAPTD